MKVDRFGLGLGPFSWGLILMLALLYGVRAASDARLARMVEDLGALAVPAAIGAAFCVAFALAAAVIAIILSLATGLGARVMLVLGAASPFLLNPGSLSAATIGTAIVVFIAGLAFGSPALERQHAVHDSLN